MKKLIVLAILIIVGSCLYAQGPKQAINKMQVIGSHNSYKEYIDTPLFLLIKKADLNAASELEYSHISLSDQLTMGLRSLEIDVFADAVGGKYVRPGGLGWAGTNPLRPYDAKGEMNEPGFKVLHVQDIDFRSNCLTLKKALTELKSWSDAHASHEPVFITINAKDDTVSRPGFTIPEKFTPETFDELDKVIVDNLGPNKLILPDIITGKFESLEKAVLNSNWPAFKEAKGKFIFILDESDLKLAYYIKDHPSLKDRKMFVNAPVGTPEAAIIIMNDPIKDLVKIQELVKKGYIVRTRADADTKEARTNDKSRFVAACKSGAQIISTDYYARSKLFKSDYIISFDNGKYIRANPILR